MKIFISILNYLFPTSSLILNLKKTIKNQEKIIKIQKEFIASLENTINLQDNIIKNSKIIEESLKLSLEHYEKIKKQYYV